MDRSARADRVKSQPLVSGQVAHVARPSSARRKPRTRSCSSANDLRKLVIARVLAEHGLLPAAERSMRTSWRTFLRARWGAIAATDFFSVEDGWAGPRRREASRAAIARPWRYRHSLAGLAQRTAGGVLERGQRDVRGEHVVDVVELCHAQVELGIEHQARGRFARAKE